MGIPLTDQEKEALAKDYIFLRWLRANGGLESIKAERLAQLGTPERLIFVCCSDGNLMQDVFQHMCHYTRRPHLLALNGGGMLLGPKNPAFETDGRVLLTNIEQAFAMGKGSVVLLKSHHVCGRGKHMQRSVKDVILDTLDGDDLVTDHLGVTSEVVLPLFHVNWSLDPIGRNEGMRTYKLKTKCRELIANYKPE